MSTSSALSGSVPPTINTIDPFQRSRPARLTRKNSRTPGKTPNLLDAPTASSRETRSLDSDRKHRLPIGPAPVDSGSRVSTPSPTRTSVDKLRARETRATRRQGSIIGVPEGFNSGAIESSTSLASTHSLGSSSSSYVFVASTSSEHEAKGFKAGRHRKADVPPPLLLKDSTIHSCSTDVSITINEPPQDARRSHRRSASASIVLSYNSSSDAAYPTPLTPSFRFEAAKIPEHREKKIQKLTRTLGENIPSSLIFPEPLRTSDDKKSPRDGAIQRTSSARRESWERRISSGTLHALDLNMLPAVPIPKKKNPKGASDWKPPNDWVLGPSDTLKRSGQDQDKKEHKLSGRWNADSYDVVIEQLRLL